GGSIGLSYNSRAGLKNLSLSCSVTESANKSTVANGHIRHDAYTSSLNGSANINFASVTYTPQISMPLINTSFAVSIKAGVTLFGVDGTGNLSGYYSEQHLERQQEQIPAFGYMNSQSGISYDRAIHDVNREKEGGFTENTPALPITNYSYDVYTVNGQGVSGNYRPFRSDLGTVYDPATSTNSLSGNLGVELAGGNLLHNGADVTITDVKTTSGKWSGDDNTSAALKFRSSVSGDPLFEPWYFKQAGETSVDSDTSLFNSIGAGDPVRVNLVDGGGTTVSSGTSLKRQHANASTTSLSIPGSNYRASRQKRNQPISYLTFAQAADALQPSILTHTHSTMAAYNPATTEGQQMQLHHIGEISVLRSDGARYVYGLPAYNIREQEVSFNVQGRSYNCGTGIVTYTEGDNGTGNSLGIDNYYSMTETPAFSHSHLLTAIISPDYVDYDAVEGPSKGDLGTYTKFSYVKSAASFKWRTPYGNHTANMNEGQKSDPADDKGNYVYGEKESWYLNKIETKNYIAVFTLSNREDGFGVKDSTGIIDTSAHLKKLDRIDLYSKPDYDANGVNATPIKSVYFEYNYSLCPGTPNRYPATSGGYSGKLTLTKIYFTYGKSY
ncbi:MAG TPA: hypothetical protein VFJ43_17910, partial [Bacteroidia bacterium]|nr:hypothetical protein [Bacteroidia bacterium]